VKDERLRGTYLIIPIAPATPKPHPLRLPLSHGSVRISRTLAGTAEMRDDVCGERRGNLILHHFPFTNERSNTMKSNQGLDITTFFSVIHTPSISLSHMYK
jgi:hypothetical protein